MNKHLSEEMEMLQCIYGDVLIYHENMVEVHMEEEGNKEATLLITLPPGYPDSTSKTDLPSLEIKDANLPEDRISCVLDSVNEQISGLAGTQMVFHIITSVKEQLFETQIQQESQKDEDSSQMRRQSTHRPMTHEEFLEWKSRHESPLEKPDSHITTGKKMFENDKSLLETDLKEIEEEIM